MSAPLHVHALLYTATCGEILEPVLARLATEPDIRVSATTMLPTAVLSYSNLKRVPRVEVHDEKAALDDFLASGGNKVLLLVADWTHLAHTTGREAVDRARAAGIPSLSVQHGVFFLMDDRLVSWDFTADRMCVWGDWFRDRLIEIGKAPERMLVTGNPRLSEAAAIEAAAGPLKTPSGTAVVALATHAQLSYPELAPRWPEERILAMVEAVFTGLARSGMTRIVVRPHPAEVFWNRVGTYVEAARRTGVELEYSNYYDEDQPSLFDLLRSADIVVTQGSTVGLYAVHTGTPVVSIALDSDASLAPVDPYAEGRMYRRLDPEPETLAARLAESVQQRPSVREVHDARAAFLAPYFRPGDAVERIIAGIRDAAKS